LLVRATDTALACAGPERFGHDSLQGARATAAFSAAAEAAVNLRRRARQLRSRTYGGADIVVGQHVAGTNDHRGGKLK